MYIRVKTVLCIHVIHGCYLIFTGMCQALRKTAVPNVPDAICDVPTWPEVGQAYWLNSESCETILLMCYTQCIPTHEAHQGIRIALKTQNHFLINSVS